MQVAAKAVVVALCFIASAGSLTAATVPAPSSAASAPVDKSIHEFTFKVDEALDATILDESVPFTVLVNHNKGAQRFVQSISIEPIGETARYYGKVECTPGAFKATELGSQNLSCVMKQKSEASWWGRILARSKGYPLRASFQFLGGTTAGESVSAPFLQVRIQAGLLPICVGGFMGAFLFALFRMVSKYLARPGADDCPTAWRSAMGSLPSNALCFAHQLFDGFVFALRGVIVAMIVIFLAQALGTSNLPFTFKVEDFYGGMIVGLFSLTISQWVAGKLGLSGSGGGAAASKAAGHGETPTLSGSSTSTPPSGALSSTPVAATTSQPLSRT